MTPLRITAWEFKLHQRGGEEKILLSNFAPKKHENILRKEIS